MTKRRAAKAAAPKPAAAAKKKADAATTNRGGRPRRYNPELARKICQQLASGKSLREICKAKGMPAQSTVRLWVVDDVGGFSVQYERARNVGLDVMADEVIAIADDQKIEPGSKRVMFDARRWYLSKLAPKRYGDKLDLNVDARVEVGELTDEQLDARVSSALDRALEAATKLLATAKAKESEPENAG